MSPANKSQISMFMAEMVAGRGGYGGLEVNEARRLRQLEDENGRLKKIVAQQALDIDARERMSHTTPPAPTDRRAD